MKGKKTLFNKTNPGLGATLRKDHFRMSAVKYGFRQSNQNEKKFNRQQDMDNWSIM